MKYESYYSNICKEWDLLEPGTHFKDKGEHISSSVIALHRDFIISLFVSVDVILKQSNTVPYIKA